MLDLRSLRALREVARCGSLSEAARALDYSQPAISHHIRRLEEEAGTALVTRFSRGVQLTEAGRRLAAHADGVFALLTTAEEDMAVIAGLSVGRVRVVAFPSAGKTLVPGALAWLKARHPAIEVSVAHGMPPESLAGLQAGACDLVVSFEYPGAVDAGGQPQLLNIPLLTGRLHAVLPRGHERLGEGELELDALKGETWIVGCERCHRGLVDACAAVGFTPEIIFGPADLVAVQSMVASDLGVALIPALLLATFQHAQIGIRALTGAPTWEVSAVVPADGPSPAAVAMLEALQAATAEIKEP